MHKDLISVDLTSGLKCSSEAAGCQIMREIIADWDLLLLQPHAQTSETTPNLPSLKDTRW